MRFKQLNEGVEHDDLQSLVKNVVSIGEFEPKTGTEDEILVVGFYCDDEAPANDLAKFIERGVSGALDTEVSPNPDDEGFYMVFVEIENNEDSMKTVFEILLDASRLANIDEWTLQFHSGKELTIGNDDIKEWLKKKH